MPAITIAEKDDLKTKVANFWDIIAIIKSAIGTPL